MQAVGAGCGITLVRAIAQDVYGPARLVKAIAYLTMAYTIGPMISPMVGGFLIDAFGWRSVFGFALGAGALITLGAYLAVFESRPPSPGTRSGGNVLADYWTLLRHPRFTAFVLQSGFCTGAFLVAATAASGLMKELLHRPSAEFGLYFLLFPFGFLAGNFITSRIGNRAANETMVLAGSVLSLAAVVAQASLLLSGHVTPLTLFAPGFFITMAQGLSLSYAQAGAMAINPKLAGTAAGMGVFMQELRRRDVRAIVRAVGGRHTRPLGACGYDQRHARACSWSAAVSDGTASARERRDVSRRFLSSGRSRSGNRFI